MSRQSQDMKLANEKQRQLQEMMTTMGKHQNVPAIAQGRFPHQEMSTQAAAQASAQASHVEGLGARPAIRLPNNAIRANGNTEQAIKGVGVAAMPKPNITGTKVPDAVDNEQLDDFIMINNEHQDLAHRYGWSMTKRPIIYVQGNDP